MASTPSPFSGVRTIPGATRLTRMRSGASSAARLTVRAWMPPLLTSGAEAGTPDMAWSTSTVPMLTMLPPVPWACIRRTTAWVVR